MDVLINPINKIYMQDLHTKLTLAMLVIWVIFACLGLILKNEKYKFYTTAGLIFFGLFQEIVDFSNRIFFDDLYIMSWNQDLPLHLCNLALITAVLLLFIYIGNKDNNYRQILFDFTYMIAFSGALNAILTVEWDFINNYLGVITGHLQHSLIILYTIWAIAAYGARFSYRSIWRTLLFLNLLIFPVGLINYFLDANYIYLCKAPNVENPLLFTKEWPWYIIGLDLLAIIYMHILYLPFWLIKCFYNDSK